MRYSTYDIMPILIQMLCTIIYLGLNSQYLDTPIVVKEKKPNTTYFFGIIPILIMYII